MASARTLSRLLSICGAVALLFLSFGPLSVRTARAYEGQAQNAKWRKAALDRIEKIRTADMTVEVVDVNGNRLRGAKVKVSMQRHAFCFGLALKARIVMGDSEDSMRLRELVEKNFSCAVLENDLKWGQWESGVAHLNETFATLRWLRERGIRARGHCVAWAPLEADDGTVSHAKSDGQGFRAALLGHAEEEVRMVGDLVSEWDVVNHPIGWGVDTIRDIAGDDIYDRLFHVTQERNPQAVLYINEDGIFPGSGGMLADADYFGLIGSMLMKGVPVQGIGLQAHYFLESVLTPPEKLLETLTRYAVFGLPIQVTEFDVRYGTAGESVRLTSKQEKLQADYTRDFLIAMFSHPSVVGVLSWGVWEGSDWYPGASMYRKDWSLKPNGRAWESLVRKRWWTNVHGKTDSNGRFVARGFFGDYAVEAAYKGSKGSATATLGASGASVTVVVH